MIEVIEKSDGINPATWLPRSRYDITVDHIAHVNLNEEQAIEVLREFDPDEVLYHAAAGFRENVEVGVMIDYLEAAQEW